MKERADHLARPGLVRLDRSLEERSEGIDTVGWARDWTFQQIQTFAMYTRAYGASPGTVIFREGATDAYLGLVTAGQVSIVKQDSAGRRKKLATFGPGKMFGELSLIDSAPRSAEAVCDHKTELLIMSKEDFDRLIHEVPHLAVQLLIKIARLMSSRLRQTSGKLIEFLSA